MGSKTYYIGLSVTYHDPALAIIDESGQPLFAEASERYLQSKRAINADPVPFERLPALLAQHCPDAGRFVVASNWRKQRPWYERLAALCGVLAAPAVAGGGFKRLHTPLTNAQIHHMMACNRLSIAGGPLHLARFLHEAYPGCAVEFRDFDHHDTHAAAACYASPFDEATCAVVDSYGEQGALAFYRFRDGRLQRLHVAHGLPSLGLFYMHLTALCGFDWMKGEEWKVMGLAAYGQFDASVYAPLKHSLRVRGLGLEHPQGDWFPTLAALAAARRKHKGYDADLAYTGQQVFAETLTELLNNFHAAYPSQRLALAGGCALNSAFNGQISANTPYREVYIPPAPADDGTALGAAWLAFRRDQQGFGLPHVPQLMTPYLGEAVSDAAVERLARYAGGLVVRHLPDTLCAETAQLLASGKLVAWMQGRAEFGPRALGNRSILADPRDPGMKDRINARVKFREEYRPFAPSILHEHGPAYFEDYRATPYMERALRFRPDQHARVPAVVHRDGSGRLQSVTADWNPRFHALLTAFQQRSDVPLLLNTSFNVMGKPIAHSVEDAIAVFMGSGLDALALNDWLFLKPEAV